MFAVCFACWDGSNAPLAIKTLEITNPQRTDSKDIFLNFLRNTVMYYRLLWNIS